MGRKEATGRVVEVQGDYVVVEIIPDLLLDVDAQFRKFFVPGKVIRVRAWGEYPNRPPLRRL